MPEDLKVTIRRLSAEEVRDCAADLAGILVDCVEDGASVSFLWPLATAEAEAFFERAAESVARGERVLLVASVGDSRLVGTVQVILAMPANQPHRCEIAKLLVHRSARRRGVAQALMHAAEAEAAESGRTLLVLDTSTGSGAEKLYLRLGWTAAGVIPGYALLPDGQPCDTTIFWKQIPLKAVN